MSLSRSIFRTQLSSRVVRAPFAARTFTSYPRALSHSDYGSGKGDPKGEDPQAQGSSASEHLEHPGPESPASKGKPSGSADPSSTPSSSSSSSKNSSEKGASSDKETKGAKPKILNESAPAADEQSQDVKQHNKEMDNRAEKSHDKADEFDTEKQKVGKQFWAGQGGADRDP